MCFTLQQYRLTLCSSIDSWTLGQYRGSTKRIIFGDGYFERSAIPVNTDGPHGKRIKIQHATVWACKRFFGGHIAKDTTLTEKLPGCRHMQLNGECGVRRSRTTFQRSV